MCSKAYITQLVQRGVIELTPSKLVDPEAADAALDANSNPGRPRPGQGQHARRGGKAAQAAKRPPVEPPEEDSGPAESPGKPGLSYNQARTLHQTASAQKTLLELRRLRGELVEAGRVQKEAFAAGQIIRQAFTGFLAKVLPTLPSEVARRLEKGGDDFLNLVADQLEALANVAAKPGGGSSPPASPDA